MAWWSSLAGFGALGCLCASILGGGFGELATLQELSRRERRAALADALGGLRAEEPEKRRSAVVRLAKLGDEDAWEALAAALADGDASVGDRAQNAFARSGSEDARDVLLGKLGLGSREPVVRARAAEALGRLSLAVDGERLAKELSSKDPGTSRLLLWSLERLEGAGHLAGRREKLLGEVQSLARQRREPELSGRALLTWAALGGEVAEAVREAARRREPALRSAALGAARAANLPDTLRLAQGLAADESAQVRAQAVDVLEALDTRAALLVLVERLGLEERLGLRWRIVSALRRRTGMHHRFDPRPWKLFVEGLPAAGRASDHARKGSGSAGVGSRSGGLELPVDSDRVAFLFDFSGSMWTPLEDGRAPKDLVAASLRQALEGLDEDTWFNLIPYAHLPEPWQEELVRARGSRVREALAFFDECETRGKGNVFDAILLALSDPKVDRIVILTDGVPTGGTHSDLDLVVALAGEFNLLRRVVFDVVLVDAPRGCVRRWERLAGRSGGRVVEVALE